MFHPKFKCQTFLYNCSTKEAELFDYKKKRYKNLKNKDRK